MNKHFFSLVCAVVTAVLGTSSASVRVPRSVHPANHPVWYLDQDDDSGAQTDSDSTGNYDVFYNRLAPEGRWFNDEDYGYVWQPNVAVSTSSWRPYSDGHWVWTDRGWFWDSNEDFGWATYHYGRWVQVEDTGWVWVPGQHWAPAWVSWRHTDNNDYIGWAPLPPESSFNASVGVHPWVDSYYDIGPLFFSFVRIGDFGRPSYREYCLPPQQNLGFFDRTTNITNITYSNNVIINYGPEYQTVSQLVQQRGGQQIPNYRLNFAAQSQANAAFRTSAQGNQLNVVAPPQTLKPVASVKPQVARELGKAQVDRGWRNVPAPQAQQFRQQLVQQSPVPKNLPPKPVLPAKPQIQEVTKGEQHPPNETGKTSQAPGGQLKPSVEQSPVPKNPPAKPVPPGKPQNEEFTKGEQHPPNETGKTPPAPGGQLKPSVEQSPVPKNPPAKPVLPGKPQNEEATKEEQHPPNETGKTPPAPGGQLKPSVEQSPVPKNPPAKPVPPGKPQNEEITRGEQHPHPPNEAEKAPPAPGSQLKPSVEKPAEKPGEKPPGEPKKPEPERANTVAPPETKKPGEPPRRTPEVREEQKARPEVNTTERPKPEEAPKGEAEHAQQNHAREPVKPPVREEATKQKKEETKKEPPPQN